MASILSHTHKLNHAIIGVAAFYMLSSTVLEGFEWQLEKIDGAKKVSLIIYAI